MQPSPRHFAATAVAAAACIVSMAACKKEEAVEVTPTSAALPAVDAARPADHVGEGELIEGTEKAFDLVLPRKLRIDHAYPDVVYASGDARADAVANYIRARVRMGSVRIGAASTIFERVQVAEHPGREVSIRVAPSDDGRGSVLEMRDVTQPKLAPSEAERWRAVGLTPDGKLVDPQHLE